MSYAKIYALSTCTVVESLLRHMAGEAADVINWPGETTVDARFRKMCVYVCWFNGCRVFDRQMNNLYCKLLRVFFGLERSVVASMCLTSL